MANLCHHVPMVESNKRTYSSPLREAQARQTRDLIVEALVEQVTQEGLADFSIPDIAKRAGVSVRTVYRHFPTRNDLLGAIEEYCEAAGGPAPPRELAGFGPFVRSLFEHFDRHEELFEALLITNLGRQVRDRAARSRTDGSLALLRQGLPDKPADDVRRLALVLRLLGSSVAWKALRDDAGLSSSEAADLVAWAAERLIQDVKDSAKTEEQP